MMYVINGQYLQHMCELIYYILFKAPMLDDRDKDVFSTTLGHSGNQEACRLYMIKVSNGLCSIHFTVSHQQLRQLYINEIYFQQLELSHNTVSGNLGNTVYQVRQTPILSPLLCSPAEKGVSLHLDLK